MKRVKTSRFLMPRIQPVYGCWINGVYQRRLHEVLGKRWKSMGGSSRKVK
jgi:hypothetical protein